MKRSTLTSLRCPLCGEAFDLEPGEQSNGDIREGYLSDPRGHRFAIRRSIPRLLPGAEGGDTQEAASVSSFGFEWTRFELPYSQEKWDRIVAQVVGVEPEYFEGKAIVDAGCGAGLHSRYLAERGAASVLALDLSEAVERARENTAGHTQVEVVQGDLMAPPLEEGCWDFVLCVGVIQHTREPERVLQNLMRLLRPGGELGVSFYTRREGFSPFLFLRSPLRWLLCRLPARALYWLTFGMTVLGQVPLLGWLMRRTVLVSDPQDLRWRTTWLCTYDWYGSHRYQRYWRPSEIRTLFGRLGWTGRVTEVPYRGLPGNYRVWAI